MTHTLGVRAASVVTAAALLGVVVIAAFSVSITLQTTTNETPLSFPVIELPPDPPPPRPAPRDPPPSRPAQQPTDITFEPPRDLPPIDLTGPSTISLPPLEPTEITNPRWLRQPSSLDRYYPARALAREITGQVLLDCIVDVNGVLNCRVMSETPTGWGFGAAALRIAADYRMVPAMRDGQAVEGRYRMRVPFQVR